MSCYNKSFSLDLMKEQEGNEDDNANKKQEEKKPREKTLKTKSLKKISLQRMWRWSHLRKMVANITSKTKEEKKEPNLKVFEN